MRLGYFADKVTKEELSLNGVTELAVNTKNCVLYLLENPNSMSEVELYVSAGRSTTIDTPNSGVIQTIKIHSDVEAVECYVELRIPGGVSIPKLSLTYDGDGTNDVLVYNL